MRFPEHKEFLKFHSQIETANKARVIIIPYP